MIRKEINNKPRRATCVYGHEISKLTTTLNIDK